MHRHHEFYAFSPESTNSESPPDHMASFQCQIGLQEQPNNGLHDLNEVPPTPRSLPSRSLTLTETISTPNITPTTGSFFMGNVNAQHIGLAGCGVERSEQQIKSELDQVYMVLQRSDRYQKYRAKQPVLTPAIMIEREEAEKQEAERKGCKVDEKKAVWPEFLERAFWRALVRWPPMGRKKCMLNGALRGRNELIQQSILGNTGINRSRKQVSSHIQVLKIHLRDEPSVLMYMATQEDDKRRRRGSGSSHTHNSVHVRGRRVLSDTAPSPQHEHNPWVSHFWSQIGNLQSDLLQGVSSKDRTPLTPYSITDFSMKVDSDDQPAHCFTQISSSRPLCDLELKDTTLWRHQFPEYKFLQSQMQDWPHTERKVLVCDASIKLLTQARPNADLSITFNLESRRDLTGFEYIECVTRFYDNGNSAPDPKFDGANSHHLKEQRIPCVYMPNPHGMNASLSIGFGSKFWVNRMLKYQTLKNKDKGSVNWSLGHLTAAQDIYGIERSTGRVECIMTILWRFSPTKTSEEAGSMTWRAFNFRAQSVAEVEENSTIGGTSYEGSDVEAVHASQGQSEHYPLAAPTDYTFFSPTSEQPPAFHQPYYGTTSQPFQVPLDSLSSNQAAIDSYSISPSTTITDSSHSSIPTMYNQDILSTHAHMPEISFENHTPFPSAFDSTIPLSEYSSVGSQSGELNSFHSSCTAATTDFVEPGHYVPTTTTTAMIAPNPPSSSVVDHHDASLISYHRQQHHQGENISSSMHNEEHIFHGYPPPSTVSHAVYQTENINADTLHAPYARVPHQDWNLPASASASSMANDDEARGGWDSDTLGLS